MPKIALISDVHGNLQALHSVMEKLEKEKPDFWLCLGDIVGYGPYAKDCISLIREKKMVCVQGNHDGGVTGTVSLNHFRNPNRKLIEITKELLSKDEIDWLKSIPFIEEGNGWVAAHASPINPEKWRYIDSAYVVRDILQKIEQPLCFIGHTHKPVIVSDSFIVKEFKKGHKYLINPGSVGQSRDGDYRASASIVDTDNWVYKNYRVEYETEPMLTGLMKLGFSRSEANHLLKL
tara:strand:- start:20134 stop:20835 length:702 start_codon:yes stop_codon:yes gene_type:complete